MSPSQPTTQIQQRTANQSGGNGTPVTKPENLRQQDHTAVDMTKSGQHKRSGASRTLSMTPAVWLVRGDPQDGKPRPGLLQIVQPLFPANEDPAAV